jgi:mono/diheme cytochrome c family protein
VNGRRRLALALAAGLAVAGLTLASLALSTGIGGADATTTTPQVAAGEANGGRALFARMACGTCHALAAAGSKGNFAGPNLDQRLRAHTAASLKATILDPPVRRGFATMPENFGSRMSDAELDTLVSFLLASRSEP